MTHTSNVVHGMKHYDHYCGICRTFNHSIDAHRYSVGQAVICNRYPGTIIEVGIGQLWGMVTVRLERGCVCVGVNDVGLQSA
jgi:hypothetical protein